MDNFIDRIIEPDGPLEIQAPLVGTTVSFSNTSDPKKWFSLTVQQIIVTLMDLSTNLAELRRIGAGNYQEQPMRRFAGDFLSDKVTKALINTQTLPVYNLLGRIVHYASQKGPYQPKTLMLDQAAFEAAIAELEAYSKAAVAIEAGIVAKPMAAADRLKGGNNTLYYGAPGTGKSHLVEQQNKGSKVFRTVFHPDMQNSDFVGTLKPSVRGDGQVSYEFRPGPFSNALKHAQENPGERVVLVVEELNRAMPAAVFGELFQLLDRDKDGTSIYSIDCPSPEFAAWYGQPSISLPSNFWIAATMNSADQGVYPMDTAFRRRWTQIYVPIDFANAPNGIIKVVFTDGNVRDVPWPKFGPLLNDYLTRQLEIPEDRLLGPWFLNEKDFEGEEMPGKLLIYLWDDLLRHHGREKLFDPAIKTYGSLHLKAKANRAIFTDNFIVSFNEGPDGVAAGEG